MPAKDNLKSARKQFQVMNTKNSVIQLQNKTDEEVEEGLKKISDGLTKSFGAADAAEILKDAIKSADATMTEIIIARASSKDND